MKKLFNINSVLSIVLIFIALIILENKGVSPSNLLTLTKELFTTFPGFLKNGETASGKAASKEYNTQIKDLKIDGYTAKKSWRNLDFPPYEGTSFLVTPIQSEAEREFIEGMINSGYYVGRSTLFQVSTIDISKEEKIENYLNQILAKTKEKGVTAEYISGKMGRVAAYKRNFRNDICDVQIYEFYTLDGLYVQVFSDSKFFSEDRLREMAMVLISRNRFDPLLNRHLKRKDIYDIVKKRDQVLLDPDEEPFGDRRSVLVDRIPAYREFIQKGYLRFTNQEDVDNWAKIAQSKPSGSFERATSITLQENNAFVILKHMGMPKYLSLTPYYPLFFVAPNVQRPYNVEGYVVFFSDGTYANC